MARFYGTPPKTNMEPENGPLEKEIPDLETIISRFQPLIFGGVNAGKQTIHGSMDPMGSMDPWILRGISRFSLQLLCFITGIGHRICKFEVCKWQKIE